MIAAPRPLAGAPVARGASAGACAASGLRVAVDAHAIGERKTGNETYVWQLLEALDALDAPGLDLLYYHTRRPAPERWRQRARRLRPHTPLLRIPLATPAALWRDRADVALFQYVVPPAAPCPTVVAVHDVSYAVHPEFFAPLERARFRALMPLSVRRATHVLTLSEFSKSQIVEAHGVPPECVTVTPLAAAAHFVPPVAPDADRDRLVRLGVHGPYVLAVGNLQPRKNLARLLRVYAELRARGRVEQTLVLVGQRAYRGSTVLALIEALGVADAVVTTGYVDDVDLVALYGGADCFVYPSHYEGFGLPILEAMACGAPVVASSAASMPEVAGDAALLVDPHSEAEMGTAIARLASDPALRADCRRRGLSRAAEFSWAETARRTLDVLARHA